MARQQKIPGTASKSINELDDAADAYVDARDKRMAKTEIETTAKEALIAAMKRHGCGVYRCEASDPVLVVTLTPGKDNVKVTELEGDADDAGDDASDVRRERRGRGRKAAEAATQGSA